MIPTRRGFTALAFLPSMLRNNHAFGSAMTIASTMETTSKPFRNVVLSSAYLMPVQGEMITAHQTREKAMDLIQETMIRKKEQERAMIVDISATSWNWDTYAIVAGKPSPVKVVLESREKLAEFVTMNEDDIVQNGVLVPQSGGKMVWMPKGAKLKEVQTTDKEIESVFVFEAPVDPNDDRLEHWEQQVKEKKFYKDRAETARDSMRNMLRFYELDRVLCWDLSWGIWEAVRIQGDKDEYGFPSIGLLKGNGDTIPLPTTALDDEDADEAMIQSFYNCARPISPKTLKENLESVSGYYLVGGNTYTMSLFHNMWDQSASQDKGGDSCIEGHMQLMRNKLEEGTVFYMGHSAGLIMSGPNILTATFKGIDAFSIVTQPYNEPYLRLPPSETPETFFAKEKNNLYEARSKMLQLMKKYNAWRGYRVVEALAFPHYDSRPRVASFPQSAETYLRATDEQGRFAQMEGSLLVGTASNKDERSEPEDLAQLRTETNSHQLPCYPVANGHAVVMECGGLEVINTLSPEEEGEGILHWDTYMPYVTDKSYEQFAMGRSTYKAGSFTSDPNTMAGDRSPTSESYGGARIFSRLEALGLPNPNKNAEGEAGRLFRSK